MVVWFSNLNPIIQTFLATLFTWGVTSLGAAVVFFFNKVNKNIMDLSLGLSAGIMLAASFWSLLDPGIDMALNLNMKPWLVISLGVFSGCLLLFFLDIFLNLIKNKSKRKIMLISSITLHNIPEGMSVGVAFGSLIHNINGITLLSAIMIALGIGIQNFPEGAAISLPLKRDGLSRFKSFFIGQLSAIVEPIFGIIGAILVMKVIYIMPFLLAFSAGAMIYVVISELIPESQSNDNKALMSLVTILGFIFMMILDISIG